jgi:hypothetical protein
MSDSDSEVEVAYTTSPSTIVPSTLPLKRQRRLPGIQTASSVSKKPPSLKNTASGNRLQSRTKKQLADQAASQALSVTLETKKLETDLSTQPRNFARVTYDKLPVGGDDDGKKLKAALRELIGNGVWQWVNEWDDTLSYKGLKITRGWDKADWLITKNDKKYLKGKEWEDLEDWLKMYWPFLVKKKTNEGPSELLVSDIRTAVGKNEIFTNQDMTMDSDNASQVVFCTKTLRSALQKKLPGLDYRLTVRAFKKEAIFENWHRDTDKNGGTRIGIHFAMKQKHVGFALRAGWLKGKSLYHKTNELVEILTDVKKERVAVERINMRCSGVYAMGPYMRKLDTQEQAQTGKANKDKKSVFHAGLYDGPTCTIMLSVHKKIVLTKAQLDKLAPVLFAYHDWMWDVFITGEWKPFEHYLRQLKRRQAAAAQVEAAKLKAEAHATAIAKKITTTKAKSKAKAIVVAEKAAAQVELKAQEAEATITARRKL